MEHDLTMGLSVWAIVAIICNSVVGVLILILFAILYKACQVPSQQEKTPASTEPKQKKTEQKCLLTAAWWCKSRRIRCSTRYQICLPSPPPNLRTPFCFCLTSFVWFVGLAEPRGVARPTTISSPNPLICAACCSTVHLPACLLCSIRADHDSLLYSPSHFVSHLSIWDKRSKNCKVTRLKLEDEKNEGQELSSNVFHAQISRPSSADSWFDTLFTNRTCTVV